MSAPADVSLQLPPREQTWRESPHFPLRDLIHFSCAAVPRLVKYLSQCHYLPNRRPGCVRSPRSQTPAWTEQSRELPLAPTPLPGENLLGRLADGIFCLPAQMLLGVSTPLQPRFPGFASGPEMDLPAREQSMRKLRSQAGELPPGLPGHATSLPGSPDQPPDPLPPSLFRFYSPEL